MFNCQFELFIEFRNPSKKTTKKLIELSDFPEDDDLLSNSKKRINLSHQKSVTGDNSYAKFMKNRKYAGRLFGVLGVDHLDEDDNILVRRNLNPKNESSLSHK